PAPPCRPNPLYPFVYCARSGGRSTKLWITFSPVCDFPRTWFSHPNRIDREIRMPATPAPTQRKKRAFWIDPRFVIGVVLVVASIAGVLMVVASADSSATVYDARGALSVGDRVTASDLVEQSVRLGAVSDKYVGADSIPAEGLVVTRSVAAGELVPVAAVGNSAGERL